VVLLFTVCGVVNCGQFIDLPTTGRANKLWVPNQASAGAALPLVVALHGCTQNPTDFAAGTGLNALADADKEGFFVLYPDQPSASNLNRCWNWFEVAHQAFGAGEPSIIVSIVNTVSQRYAVDASRVYALGLSAGGAMSAILGATYPNVFSAIAVGSGLEFKAATSLLNANLAMLQGGPAPATQGRLAYTAMGTRAKVIGVIVFHGTQDFTVYQVNGGQVVSQYATTLDLVLGSGTARGIITDKPTNTTTGTAPVTGGRAYTINSYADTASKRDLIRYVTVTGMAHAWSGGTSGTYTDAKGPNASVLALEFFAGFRGNSTTFNF